MTRPVLVLSRYSRLGASSRLRTMQYRPYLAAEGLAPTYSSLFDDDYLERLYAKRSTSANVARAVLARIRQLRNPGTASLLWIEKEPLPWLPWPVEKALLPRGLPLATDFDDAIFHRYDLHRSAIVRRVLGRKIDRIMAASEIVLAGNAYLAERANKAGARRVEIVPTVVDLDAYGLRDQDAPKSEPRIGWIGTPQTWEVYLAPMMPELDVVAARTGARISAVGAGKEAGDFPFVDAIPWTENTEIACIQDMDIGIMPLDDTPWARGKCGYKLIQYMACGIPVVASPVGVNREIVEHGVNGFLATTGAEWRAALTTLLGDPDLRRKMAAEGRRKVENEFSLQVWGPRVARMLKDIARNHGR